MGCTVCDGEKESFTGTELDYAVEVCEAVMDVYEPTPENKIILNLPATVEMATPNIYADQIEWFCRNFPRRDSAVISLHTHNDRGTGVAATELGLMAGAQRVEGTLFGNGERTGNCDLVTVAMNMFSQGVDPTLDLRHMPKIREVSEAVTKLAVHERHPYAGELVFTAFSGSHQDAIKKGMSQVDRSSWEVPYLPIDPEDVGSSYKETVRVNSQSGKGGVGFLLEEHHGLALPRDLLVEFSSHVQQLTEQLDREVKPDEIYHLGAQSYVSYSFEDEFSTLNTNINGTHYVLSAIKEFASDIKFYFAASSEMFGKAQEVPQSENTPFHPRSAYGISKMTGYHLVKNLFGSYVESFYLFIRMV